MIMVRLNCVNVMAENITKRDAISEKQPMFAVQNHVWFCGLTGKNMDVAQQ
jgi:hypothetical protein